MRITAPASAYPSLNPTPFILTVKFRTLARSAFVTFAQIEMFQPGDPSGVGEDSFAFAVYDRDAAKQLGSVEHPGGLKTVSMSAGSKPLIHKQIDVPMAPRHLRLWASGHDFDSLPFYGGLNEPVDAPAAMPAGPDSGLNASGEWAAGTRDTDLPTIWGQFVIPYVLNVPNGGVRFLVRGDVSGSVTGLAQIKKFSASLGGLGLPGPWGGRRVDRSQASVVGKIGDILIGVGLAPNGSLLVHADRRPPRNGWIVLDDFPGPALHALVAGGRAHFVGLSESGELLHRSWQVEDRPDAVDEWQTIAERGAARQGVAVVAADGGGIDVYAAAGNGRLRRYGAGSGADPRAAPPEDLGHLPGNDLRALRALNGGLHLFSIDDDDGTVWHRYCDGRPRHTSQDLWTALGRLPGARFELATDAESDVSVVAVTPGGRLRVKEWSDGRWSPTRDGWEDLGTVSGFFQAHLDEELGRQDQDRTTPP